jgi:hypothetical protein
MEPDEKKTLREYIALVAKKRKTVVGAPPLLSLCLSRETFRAIVGDAPCVSICRWPRVLMHAELSWSLSDCHVPDAQP